jgi:recyclin-1
VTTSTVAPEPGSGITPSTAGPNSARSTTTADVSSLELLLSLDVALELIHADREALKRCDAFGGYPGHYGHRVRDTREELFVLFLDALSARHLTPGFGAATARMRAYEPAVHGGGTRVAPLLQFFELVHIGDTIQSIVQVYFDKEVAHLIDRTDFLNTVVREKKRFENALDDAVAAGLNAGTEVLMNQVRALSVSACVLFAYCVRQVEHIILTRAEAREYYPPEGAAMDLKPTRACTDAIQCLETHCALLKDSTSKEVLEVFYQEVGFRLIA